MKKVIIIAVILVIILFLRWATPDPDDANKTGQEGDSVLDPAVRKENEAEEA